MRKIAIFAPAIYSYGGEQRVVTIIANELSKDNQITIFACDGHLNHEQTCYSMAESIEINSYFQYSKRPLKRILRYIERTIKPKFYERHPMVYRYIYYGDDAAKKIIKILDENYDIAIAVSGHLSILLGYAKKMGLKCKAIGWEHNSYEAYFQTPNMYLWKREQFFVEAARHLDSCVVLNEDIAAKYKMNLGITCDVIYNPRSFESKEKSTVMNKSFVACGRFVRAKGFDFLVQAFSEYAKKEKDWKLVIIGDGQLRQEIEEQVRQEGLSERVIFTGFITNVREKMLESSIYLLSSRWEGFPMCVTEAYEVGLPIISFDIPAVLPLLNNGEGIKVRAYDIHDFAEAMLKLSSDTELRKNMAARAVRTADSLSIDCIGNKWRELFDR